MNYDWLKKEPAPKMLVEALKLLGTTEIPGPKSNPVILAWAKEVGLHDVYKNDDTPWCGLVMAVVAKRAGYAVPDGPLWALNWNKFGERTYEAKLGYILTFSRTGGGHVGIYVGEDSACYHVLGGNQNNTQSIIRIEKGRISQIRKPIYKIGEPSNVRKIILDAKGTISQNEA